MLIYKDLSVLIKNKNFNCNMCVIDMCKCNIEWNYWYLKFEIWKFKSFYLLKLILNKIIKVSYYVFVLYEYIVYLIWLLLDVFGIWI